MAHDHYLINLFLFYFNVTRLEFYNQIDLDHCLPRLMLAHILKYHYKNSHFLSAYSHISFVFSDIFLSHTYYPKATSSLHSTMTYLKSYIHLVICWHNESYFPNARVEIQILGRPYNQDIRYDLRFSNKCKSVRLQSRSKQFQTPFCMVLKFFLHVWQQKHVRHLVVAITVSVAALYQWLYNKVLVAKVVSVGRDNPDIFTVHLSSRFIMEQELYSGFGLWSWMT